MINIRHLLLCVIALIPAAVSAVEELKNQLSGHPSAYLAMHGEDPVSWQTWGPQALEKARDSGRLVFVSSGYFSCHWCHVMQRESYQNKEIALILNNSFIPIKIDRELEPVLDEWLMEFIQETRGQGGWPLNIFITPEGDPLIGALYMPPERFKAFLVGLDERWNENRQNLKQTAAEAARIMRINRQESQRLISEVPIARLEEKLISQTLQIADEMEGGFGQQAKFPLAPKLSALITLYSKRPSQRMREFLTLTLHQMAHNGLYDHLGGGFYRYTVDPHWRIPHYEKMLYDNAQLVQVYFRAAEVFSMPEFIQVSFSTLDFMLAEMESDQGGFVAALSAVDDQGREGAYYQWDNETLRNTLNDQEYEIAVKAWGLSGPDAQEHGYLPVQDMTVTQLATAMQLDEKLIVKILTSAREKLLTVRKRRHLPKDDKRLSSWNGLTLSALTEAAQRDSKRYSEAARRLHEFIITRLWAAEGLVKAVDRTGQGLGPANLEDYANIARGLLDWARFTGETGDDQLAAEVVLQAWRRFHASEGWKTSENNLIYEQPARHHISDNTTPSPSATILRVSLELIDLPVMAPLRGQILENLKRFSQTLSETPFSHATQVSILSQYEGDMDYGK
jgi:uncharacterized protein YyaL (SSP411 family)